MEITHFNLRDLASSDPRFFFFYMTQCQVMLHACNINKSTIHSYIALETSDTMG